MNVSGVVRGIPPHPLATKETTAGLPWSDGRKLSDLDFADDIALIGRTVEEGQALTGALVRFAEMMEAVEDIPGTALQEGIEWGELGLPKTSHVVCD